ncbi:hypothetical protein GF373_00250 [bacterium]|nr:hypothetical protein [bacterium]
MNLSRLYRELNGSQLVHFDESMGVMAAWNGASQLKFYDNEGQCIDTLIVEESPHSKSEAELIMIEHLEGVDQKN